jgi:hypothetical protein
MIVGSDGRLVLIAEERPATPEDPSADRIPEISGVRRPDVPAEERHSMTSPTNADGIVDPEGFDRRKPRLAPRFSRTPNVDQPGIDHDDLLELLDRPRPAHGDIHTLLRRRRSVTRGEADRGR